jgi:hypothetical protein
MTDSDPHEGIAFFVKSLAVSNSARLEQRVAVAPEPAREDERNLTKEIILLRFFPVLSYYGKLGLRMCP